MQPGHWQRIEQLYHAALQHETSQRPAFLQQACCGDEILKHEVESLLDHAETTGTFLQGPAIRVLARLLARHHGWSSTKSVDGPAVMIGKTVAHYQILETVGCGGMGVVYKARDIRLGRLVALKFLSESAIGNLQALERFKREAQAASALNHPNICTLYDVGRQDEIDFLVMEYLNGETLRHRLKNGLLQVAELLQFAVQLVSALDYAHHHGVVHRDLKPGNVMLTRSGLKILDFGVAKFQQSRSRETSAAFTPDSTLTKNGSILGTLAYMSPEQVRGEKADERSDIFSVGAILYEMATGKQAFTGESQADVIAAVLTSKPEITGGPISSGVHAVISHCLEKDPDQRFQCARDLAFHLALLSKDITTVQREVKQRSINSKVLWLGVALVFLTLSFLVAGLEGWFTSKGLPTYRQLTFRRGSIGDARFAPGGQMVVYDAAWEGKPSDIFESQLQSPESRPLGLPNSYLAAVSTSGELAILRVRGPTSTRPFGSTGTLARVSITGGSPRDFLENVYAADWSPDGSSLAVIQLNGTSWHVEYPLGIPVCRLNADEEPIFRIAPDGQTLAVKQMEGGRPHVSLFRNGKIHESTVAHGFSSIRSLAWNLTDAHFRKFAELKAARDESHTSEAELLVTGLGAHESNYGLYAISRDGRMRALTHFPYDIQLQDVWKGEKYLLKAHHEQSVSVFRSHGGREIDLSWLDHTHAIGLSADGGTLLINEVGEGADPDGTVYLRRTNGSPAIRLCTGLAFALSADGNWALTASPGRSYVALTPTAVGESRNIQLPSNMTPVSGTWSADGKHILLTLRDRSGLYSYIQDLREGIPTAPLRALAGVNVAVSVISPDGRYLIARPTGEKLHLYNLNGASTPIAGSVADERALSFSSDGKSVYTATYQSCPARAKVFRTMIATGQRELRTEIMLSDPAGIPKIDQILITPDGRNLVYSFHRVLNELLVAEGF